MTAFDFPAAITPSRSQIQIMDNTASFNPSPFSGYVQGHGRFGSRMGLTLEFSNLKHEEGQLMRGFCAHLHGLEHRVKIHDHSYQKRGVFTGAPLIDGASQGSGYALDVKGLTSDITIVAGNQFSYINGDSIPELKMVTADTLVSGTGTATLPIWPDIHSAPADEATITIASPQGHFMMPSGPTFSNEPGDWSSFSLFLIEDWL